MIRFGRSNWNDADRLNLMTVCNEKSDWKERVSAMGALYTQRPGYGHGFTEAAMREELERILQLPTPNLRVDPTKHFVFSRSLMMEKWIGHFKAEVAKEASLAREKAQIQIRQNNSIMKNLLGSKMSEEQIQKLMEMANGLAEKNKNDPAYSRTVGSAQAAILENLKEKGGTLDLSGVTDVPATKQPDGETMNVKVFQSPQHKTQMPESAFSSPTSAPMLSLADAVREAAPVPPPPQPKFASPEPPTYSAPIEDISGTMPDDILEPPQQPSPVKSAPKEKTPTVPVAPISPVKPATPQNVPVPPKKKRDPSPVEEKEEEEETTASPSQSPRPSESTPTVGRSRGRPRIERKPVKKNDEPTPQSTKKAEKEKEKEKQEVKKPVIVESSPPTPEPAEPPVTPAAASSAKRRLQETSQEPTTSTSASNKKPRQSGIQPTPTMSTRRKKESTEEPPTPRAEKSETPATHKKDDKKKETPGIHCQTDITIRPIILEGLTVGERYRSNIVGTHQKKKTKKKEGEEEEAVVPPVAAAPVEPVTYSNQMTQTNLHFDLSPKDVVVMRIEMDKRDFHRIHELSVSPNIVVNEETCREIEKENAASTDNSFATKRAAAAKVDGKKEISFIVESEECITQRLVEEKGYHVVSQNTDLPTTHESPQKRPRRDERAREEMSTMKSLLLKLHRDIYDNEWSEAFKRPVPPGEEPYDVGVKQKIDLSGIRREIEQGVINSVPSFLLKAYRMLSNAIMFNGYEHDVHILAKEMVDTIMAEVAAEALEKTSANYHQSANSTPQSTRRNRPRASHEPTSRTGSMEPEPAAKLGAIGKQRSIFRKDANLDMPMTTEGCRKSKKGNR